MKANEINCKDLMIGDWVYRPDCYDQVKEIRENGIIGLDSQRGLIAFSELEPIPLTPEILEKNGFVWDNLPMEQYWEQYGLIIYPAGGGYRMNCGQNVSFKIDSVHELQHLFRLCGIDKEIVV